MMAKYPSFHLVGDAYVDLMAFLGGDLPEPGGDSRLTHAVKMYAGGSSINTATHLQSLLHYLKPTENEVEHVALYTVLNKSDEFGKILLRHAAKYSIQLNNCCSCGTDTQLRTGHCLVLVAAGGTERSFLTHQGCVDSFTASSLDWSSLVCKEGPIHLHVAGFFNMQGFWHGQLREKLEALRDERDIRKQPTTISMVTQHDATQVWNGGLDEVIKCLDFLIMNELEATRIVQRGLQVVPTSDDLIPACQAFFSDLSSHTHFVITRGARGAVSFQNGNVTASVEPAMRVDKVVDPTGAGDSFTAGFLYGVWGSKGKRSSQNLVPDAWTSQDLKTGLQWGCAVGTAAVSVRGASKPAKYEDIMLLYDRQKFMEGSIASTK